jgi:hypothetical protein
MMGVSLAAVPESAQVRAHPLHDFILRLGGQAIIVPGILKL